jgi:peptide/nickel transport system permease protein
MTLLLTRLFRALVSLVVIVTLVFVALRVTGDPILAMFNPDDYTEAALESYRRQYGYTGTVFEQYLAYVANVFQGHFGISSMSNRDAVSVVIERVPATLQLVGWSALTMFAVGIPVGAVAALNAGGRLDRIVMAGSTVGFAMPNFVLGLGLILLFAVYLHWLPSNGIGGWEHMVMPVLTIGLAKAAIFTRFVRSSVLDALKLSCVTSARARGLTEWQIFIHHVIPNALLPLVTIAPLLVGAMVSAGSVVESVFGWPGIGRLIVESVANRDLAVLQVIIMLVAALMITTNLIVDLAYARLDPRTTLARSH